MMPLQPPKVATATTYAKINDIQKLMCYPQPKKKATAVETKKSYAKLLFSSIGSKQASSKQNLKPVPEKKT